MQHVLITGGSGLIGQRITALLEAQGKSVAWLSRSTQSQKSFLWDVEKKTIDPEAMEWADAIIHLAGAGVADKRWSDERKKVILESRTHSTQLLFDAIEKAEKKPDTFVSASAIGYYGFQTGPVLLEESAPNGVDFLAKVVRDWEAEVKKIEGLHLRTVILRIGIVLDEKGGALGEMLKPPVAAPLGKGDQWMSWIHIEDLARMFVFALEKTTLQGIFNAVSPNPATNYRLTQEAARAKGKPFIGIGVPEFILNLVLGEMSAMVTGGNRVSSQKIQKASFEYEHPILIPALKDIFHN
ncbi:TIGR01777 family oxidoreductase [Algoriphagus machipongonensis]|uniref:NAD-dependent epimerase/dehydratase family protein n=1 Tax=Algoriphagus machipongonensis TaxID=388413 RepID=A3HUF4_9BACT|nr:TIGR01777 family oxidoreductase [Algoriphagus machipongonensis]EAZ81776.1 NAD-dependent epimerase/dehydratase family protein [Algoriphagus machipongonensis]